MAEVTDSRNVPHNPVPPAMVNIPAGWFWMGSDAEQDVEQPVHRVWVDEFALAETQVTNADYAPFLKQTQAAPPLNWNAADFCDPQQPVVGVNWFEAIAYCEWLSRKLGGKYRLPTEAEWERAARGNLERALYPWGDEPPQTRAGYGDWWLRGPERARQSQPNFFGLFEMCENVHEWCSDWFATDYYAHSPEQNPPGPDLGTRRASRGGSWRHHVKISRCAARSSIPPEFKYADYGFRLAGDR